ncbi:unnamed protein product, partial [Haemonchus placei]|uniref:DNA helicase n=1 Tax=Haemonchus placei TaxID=6290 RepID=A0A0N4XBH3_HAEPC
MIVAPDTLVPCTSIAGATWCPRKVILSDRFRGPTEANKAMLIGTIVHELFQAAVRCPIPRMVSREWLLHIWQKTIRDEIIAQLVALRFTPSQFETELEPYLEVIVDWVQHNMPQGKSYKGLSENSLTKVHDIEENIWLPQLGLKGKIDATLEVGFLPTLKMLNAGWDSVCQVKCGERTRKQSLELKTGKSGQSSEHAAQVMLYSLMLSSRYKQPIGEGSLLYLKDGITRRVQPRALEMKGIINQRNHLASYLSKLRPDLLPVPKDDPKFCERCDHALVCSFYQMNRTVLLTTNTHSALDNVLIKLRKYTSDSKILRLGNPSSVRDSVADLSLESKLSCCDGDKYKAAREILKETPLVASTCHYVPRDVLFSWRKFDYCIIDEASMVSQFNGILTTLDYVLSQAFPGEQRTVWNERVLEPVVISPVVAASRFVLVGDAHQLSPLVQSRKC